MDVADLWAWLQQHQNDLEHAAVALVPEIGHILTLLRQYLAQKDAFCGMSGSGSTCFIISPDATIIHEALGLFAGFSYKIYHGKLLKS